MKRLPANHFLHGRISKSIALWMVAFGMWAPGMCGLTPAFSDPLPKGGVPLIEGSKLQPDQLRVRLGGGGFGTQRVLPSSRTEFEQSLQLNVVKRPPNTWDVGVKAATTAPVEKGDAILVGFWARGKAADGHGGAVAEFVFERNGAPYTKSVQYLVETPADGSWQHVWVRCRSLEDYQPGQAVINFQAGYIAARLEIAGIEACNFADRVKLTDLPHTALTYVGRSLDAPWRIEAERRIDQHRRADLSVTVVDAGGKPRAGVPVHVHLDRLGFDFGSAVAVRLLTGEGADAERYRKTFLEMFNLGVIENALKWQQWEAHPGNQPRTIDALRWFGKQGIPVRGHVMVWPGYRYLPKRIKALAEDPDALREAIDEHIGEVGAAAGDRVRDWDVLNEVYANRDLTDVLGDGAMVHWFRVARSVAPRAKLYYNDYAGLVRGGFPTGHKDHFEKTLRYLVDQGAPIDGIGIQGHFGSLLTPPQRLYAELNRWGALGLGILVTEFDVTVPNEQLRADYTRDFLTVCFSHPDVDGILAWGFWAGAHWRPEAAFFTRDWQLTPVGRAWADLTTKTWRTDETRSTDAHGRVQLRAFLGDYTVTSGETKKTFRHQKPGSEIRLMSHSKIGAR